MRLIVIEIVWDGLPCRAVIIIRTMNRALWAWSTTNALSLKICCPEIYATTLALSLISHTTRYYESSKQHSWQNELILRKPLSMWLLCSFSMLFLDFILVRPLPSDPHSLLPPYLLFHRLASVIRNLVELNSLVCSSFAEVLPSLRKRLNPSILSRICLSWIKAW